MTERGAADVQDFPAAAGSQGGFFSTVQPGLGCLRRRLIQYSQVVRNLQLSEWGQAGSDSWPHFRVQSLLTWITRKLISGRWKGHNLLIVLDEKILLPFYRRWRIALKFVSFGCVRYNAPFCKPNKKYLFQFSGDTSSQEFVVPSGISLKPPRFCPLSNMWTIRHCRTAVTELNHASFFLPAAVNRGLNILSGDA